MLVHNVNIIGTQGLTDIRIRNEKIGDVFTAGAKPNQKDELSLSFHQAIAFPGLINSHDHLDFNLFPQLGNKIYKNYTEWGKDIQVTNKEEISRVLQIPLPLRVQWGIYKNLLNGITTVVNHGKLLPIKEELITVFQRSRSLHSPAFEKNWKWKINFSFTKDRPFVIHLGEGTDEAANREIDSFIKWNIFKRKVVAIHGVAMSKRQASAFRALIWCPASNYFLLNKTAAVNTLSTQVSTMLGTDSTLTASWNLWDHLRLARKEKMISDEGLMNMLTSIPANNWGLDNCGKIAAGQQADIVVAADKNGMKGMNLFYALNPEDLLMVIHKGNIRLFDERLLDQLNNAQFPLAGFSKIALNGKVKYVEGDLPGLMQRIRKYYPAVEFPISASRSAQSIA